MGLLCSTRGHPVHPTSGDLAWAIGLLLGVVQGNGWALGPMSHGSLLTASISYCLSALASSFLGSKSSRCICSGSLVSTAAFVLLSRCCSISLVLWCSLCMRVDYRVRQRFQVLAHAQRGPFAVGGDPVAKRRDAGRGPLRRTSSTMRDAVGHILNGLGMAAALLPLRCGLEQACK